MQQYTAPAQAPAQLPPQVTPAPATDVVTAQPLPVPALTPLKAWTWGLFDVPDCGLFALSWFCPCLVFGRTARAIGQSYVFCCLVYLITLVNIYVLPLHILLGCLFRERVRLKYRIQGNVCCDLLAYTLCCPCTLNQEALQADAEQRALASAGAQGTNGMSKRLGSRVISLRAGRAAPQATTSVPNPVPNVQAPLLGPSVTCVPAGQPIPAPMPPVASEIPTMPPYPVQQQHHPVGFVLPPAVPEQM